MSYHVVMPSTTVVVIVTSGIWVWIVGFWV
jgi:hypothetical protein